MSSNGWAVYRLDFTGNQFVVETGLTDERAVELVEEFESRKHHQHYWAQRSEKAAVDYVRLLRDLLSTGSALGASLEVLRNQNVTEEHCVEAVRIVRGLDLDDAKLAVSSCSNRITR